MKTRIITLLAIGALAIGAQAQTAAPSPTPTSTPPDYLAQAQAANVVDPVARAARVIMSTVPAAAAQDYKTIATAATLLWRDPTKAQAIVDQMAEHAAPIFVTYGALIGPLSYVSPTNAAKLPPIPPGYGYTILPPTATAADGSPAWPVGQRSVVITYTAPTPTPSPTP